MPTINTTTMKGIGDVGSLGPTEIVRDNLIDFFDWGLIDNGGYFNITIPRSGAYGGNFHQLRPVIDTRYTNGQVWEGFRKNWVWESGLTVGSPIRVSGVNVNGAFKPSSGVAYPHHVDYPLGRVVFNTAIPTSSVVTCEYSTKLVQVFNLNDIPGLRQVQYGSFKIDDSTFFSTSGNWTLPSQNRVQMPAVGLSMNGPESYRPLQIGGGQWKQNTVFAYIFSEDESTGLRLADYLSQQKEKGINLYDENRMNEENRIMLNYDGSIANGAMTYYNLVQPSSDGGYAYKTLYFKDAEVLASQYINTNLYYSLVKFKTEITLDV